jgi:hypothetical protein
MDAAALLDARRILLGGLIDYAGLFPPASLGMEEAVAGYREARSGAHSWMLGRFIATASHLEELAGILTASMVAGEPAWPVSVVLDGNLAAASARAQSFDAHMGNAAEVVLTEARLPAGADPADRSGVTSLVHDVARAATSVSPTVTAFLEVPRTDRWEREIPVVVAAIGAARRDLGRPVGAKFRCGGTIPGAFPSVEQVARFLAACRAEGLPYKMTAGLHHPLRRRDPGLGVTMHGFLNILAAAGLAEAGADQSLLLDVLGEVDPAAFDVTRSGLSWRDSHLGVAAIRRLRNGRFPSFGSCSFDEPIADLIDLGLVTR